MRQVSDEDLLKAVLDEPIGAGAWWLVTSGGDYPEPSPMLRSDELAEVVDPEQCARLAMMRPGDRIEIDDGELSFTVHCVASREQADALAAELLGPMPGDVIAEVKCPMCGADLSVEHGDDEGEISVVGTKGR